MLSINLSQFPQDESVKTILNQNQTDLKEMNTIRWVHKPDMKGAKINLKNYRQKQALKSQCINHSLSKNYTINPNFEIEQTFPMEASVQVHHNNGFAGVRKAGFSADAAMNNKRKKKSFEQIENIKSRTMMVTSSNAQRKKSKTIRSFNMFNSDNLGTRMNQYMNIFIRQDMRTISPKQMPGQIGADQINYTGVLIPHSKKLTNFSRRLKYSKRKIEAEASISLENTIHSPQAQKNSDFMKFSKTLNLKSFRSPLINSIEHRNAMLKTISITKSSKNYKDKKKIVY